MEEVGPVGLEMVDWTKMAAYNTAASPSPKQVPPNDSDYRFD